MTAAEELYEYRQELLREVEEASFDAARTPRRRQLHNLMAALTEAYREGVAEREVRLAIARGRVRARGGAPVPATARERWATRVTEPTARPRRDPRQLELPL